MASRAQETSDLLLPVVAKLTELLAKADTEYAIHQNKVVDPQISTALISSKSGNPEDLQKRIATGLEIPEEGTKKDGLLAMLDSILQYSVNTSCPGFMDKLYGSPLPPGIAAELILGVLNTNVHVYQVSPMLTLIEKHVTKALAVKFGFNGPRAGGVSVQGGSASNMTSIVAARNSLFPNTKLYGNSAQNDGRLTLLTSAHGHYSIEKAAQALGFGSQSVIPVPVDEAGRMMPSELNRLIEESKASGFVPFYVNATAGTTVLGSFDPFEEIAAIAKRHRCWLHVDGAWGGSFVFAHRQEMTARLKGVNKADSIAINPHKMLGVPMTCSFLLTRDLKLFQTAMTLKAGYLFHEVEDEDNNGEDVANDETSTSKGLDQSPINGTDDDEIAFDARDDDSTWEEPYDLADLTLQCGRRGDSLKMFMSWQYYGTNGYREKLENAYDIAVELAQLIDNKPDLTLVLGTGARPECLQVCFYYTPGGQFVFASANKAEKLQVANIRHSTTSNVTNTARKSIGKRNTMVTSRISKALIARGFMIDFAPALEGQEDRGSFFRVVVNISTIRETTTRLVDQLLDVGNGIVKELQKRYSPRA